MNVLEDKTPAPVVGELNIDNLRRLDAANENEKKEKKGD
jgi:hypothetical protein